VNITGIICEYNPFHKGHAYQIAAAKEKSDAPVVCVMSGNFVQRGDAAVFRKQVRAEAALMSGADLVLELPTPWAAGSVGHFACGAVHILASTGLPVTLCFGSESGDVAALERAAGILLSADADALTGKYLEKGLSYAEAQQKAADELLGDESALLKTPNNLLGIEYLKAAKALNANITPLTVLRKGPAHNGGEEDGFASASLLRSMLFDDEE